MVLILFGDTHELHREVEIPAGDILICVGDFKMFSKSLSAIKDFNEWLGGKVFSGWCDFTTAQQPLSVSELPFELSTSPILPDYRTI
jgi:hypothetical protein